MYESILKVLNKDYDAEVPDNLRSKEFCKEIKKYINKQLKPYNLKISKMLKGTYCYASGFITDGEKYVYFSTPDYRWGLFGKEWYDDILIRTAENEEDYHGGDNCSTKLCDIGLNVKQII